MSQRIMEAWLVKEILELRAHEDALTTSYAELQSTQSNEAYAVMNWEFKCIEAKLQKLEQLLSDMNAPAIDLPLIPTQMPTMATSVRV